MSQNKDKENKGVKPKKSYSNKTFEDVLEKLRNNETNPYAASKLYGIPRQTLVNHLKKKSLSTVKGRPTVFNTDEERTIVDHLIALSKIGYGLDQIQLQKVLQSFVIRSGKVNPFKNNMPGFDWIYGYY